MRLMENKLFGPSLVHVSRVALLRPAPSLRFDSILPFLSAAIVALTAHCSTVALPSLSRRSPVAIAAFLDQHFSMLAPSLSWTKCALERHGIHISNSTIVVACTDGPDSQSPHGHSDTDSLQSRHDGRKVVHKYHHRCIAENHHQLDFGVYEHQGSLTSKCVTPSPLRAFLALPLPLLKTSTSMLPWLSLLP